MWWLALVVETLIPDVVVERAMVWCMRLDRKMLHSEVMTRVNHMSDPRLCVEGVVIQVVVAVAVAAAAAAAAAVAVAVVVAVLQVAAVME
jgi:hypothetical protein